MKKAYINKRFHKVSLQVIETTNNVITDYMGQGYDLTLRQLYYQFIANDLFPDAWLVTLPGGQQTKNHERNYKKLGSILNDGRLAGLVDWAAIKDRTRKPKTWQSFQNIQDALEDTIHYYCLNPWDDQESLVEIWVEKEALAGVFERTAMEYHVPLFCCRGYHSQSSAYEAAQRFRRDPRPTTVLHFGDHDPSGLDMTRDIIARFETFGVYNVEIDRCALNMDQVNRLNPPPSPAKITDSRAEGYIAEFGNDSWELDAINPAELNQIAEDKIEAIIDRDDWDDTKERQARDKETLQGFIDSLED